MANINSLMSNSYGSTNSLYGNRNVLTGLASGLDTESMIQNSVYAYQLKIMNLQQSQTKLTWKQDAYRSITDQMNSILQKYTSYTSKTNLASNAFFSSAIKTETVGAHASAISATGSTKSDVRIDAVTQLATAARYTVDAKKLDVEVAEKAMGETINWNETQKVGQLKGSITLTYDANQKIELTFDESDTNINSLVDLKKAIEKKLANTTIRTSSGDTVSADTIIKVGTTEEDGNVTFKFSVDKDNAATGGASVYISGISGNVGNMLGAKRASSSADPNRFDYNSFTLAKSDLKDLVKEQSMAEYLSGKTIDITVDGVKKSIKIGDLKNVEDYLSQETKDALKQFDNDIAEWEKKIATSNTHIAGYEGKREIFSKALEEYQNELNGLLKEDGSFEESDRTKVEELQAKIKEQEDGLTRCANGIATQKKAIDEANSEIANLQKQKGDAIGNDMNAALENDLKESIKNAFGDKVTFEITEDGRLSFGVVEGSMIRVTSSAGEALGITKNGVSNYLNTSSTLGKLVDERWLDKNARIKASGDPANFNSRGTGDEGDEIKWYDEDGKRVMEELDADGKGTGNWYRVDEDGNALYGLEINGTRVGEFTKNSTLESIITSINGSAAGVKISYSNLTGEFVFTATETGSGGKITFDNALAQQLFCVGGSTDGVIDVGSEEYGKKSGVEYTGGQDAEIYATVNGKTLKLTRSTNVVEMDGMTVTLKDTFNKVTDNGDGKYEFEGEAVTFKTHSDADNVVDTIKTFVEDINNLLKSVREAYTTQPLTKSGSTSNRYEPLTDEDKEGMSESAIKTYEEKAKTGLLFGDTDLSQLYEKLVSVLQATGADRMDMEAIGLTTTFSGGLTQIALDEDKLRAALESDPDKVRNVFAKTVEGGSKTNGLMESIKSPLNTYGSTSLGSPGILVGKAGSKLSAISLMNNNLQKQIDNIDKQIESWQSKLSSKVDYYTRQFTALEQLMSTMNNQSSMLASLMGGY